MLVCVSAAGHIVSLLAVLRFLVSARYIFRDHFVNKSYVLIIYFCSRTNSFVASFFRIPRFRHIYSAIILWPNYIVLLSV